MRSLPAVKLAVLALCSAILSPGATPAYYAGGDKDADKGNDCLIGYNGIDQSDVTVDGKKQMVECTDCDPTCDFDGVSTANNSCTFKIGVCLNQATTSCERPNGLAKASAKYKVKGKGGVKGEIALEDPTKLMSSACGSFVELIDLPVDLKEKKDGTFTSNTATFKLSGLVKKDKDTPKRKDKDKLTYVCLPREGACPNPTTTTTSSTTPTTAESTTTSSSTTSSTIGTTTTTSTTVLTTSTTSTTVVTTTSTSLPTTTSTTLVSTTSTSVVTTTSTTTTTINQCGNGMIDFGEECDGTDFGDATCPGSTTGAFLECTPECTIDYSNCPVVSTTSTTTLPSTTSTSTTVETTSTSTTTVETTSTSTSTTLCKTGGLACTGGDCCVPWFCLVGTCSSITTTTSTITTTSTTTTTCVQTSGLLCDLGNGTVYDGATGLQWEKKDTTVDSGVDPGNLHDVDNIYVWAGVCSNTLEEKLCQPNTQASNACKAQIDSADWVSEGCTVCGVGEGTCLDNPFDYGTSTVWDWLGKLNTAAFAGHSDWRLPTSHGCCDLFTQDSAELESLLLQPCGVAPCINSILGPTISDRYWTGSTLVGQPVTGAGPDAWVVIFADLSVGSVQNEYKHNGSSVRAVR